MLAAMRPTVAKGISLLSASALAFVQIAPAVAQSSMPINVQQSGATDGPKFTRRDYENCQTEDETVFRKAIREITLKALREGTKHLNYDQIVAEQWRKGRLDDLIDRRVDIAVSQVREETSWSKLIQSLAYREQAQELAKAAAERTYHSDAIKAALEELATRVGEEIGKSIVPDHRGCGAPRPTLPRRPIWVRATAARLPARSMMMRRTPSRSIRNPTRRPFQAVPSCSRRRPESPGLYSCWCAGRWRGWRSGSASAWLVRSSAGSCPWSPAVSVLY